MEHFYKVKNKTTGNIGYLFDDFHPEYGEIFRNFSGGWSMKSSFEVVEDLGEQDKDTFINIHRKEIFSYLIEEESPYGWLSPSCVWYPCDFRQHEEVAVFYFDSDTEELEERGWLKIFRDFPSFSPTCFSRRISSAQQEWCENHGVVIL